MPLRRQSEIEDFGALLLQVLDGNTPLWDMATTALGILRRVRTHYTKGDGEG